MVGEARRGEARVGRRGEVLGELSVLVSTVRVGVRVLESCAL